MATDIRQTDTAAAFTTFKLPIMRLVKFDFAMVIYEALSNFPSIMFNTAVKLPDLRIDFGHGG